MKTKEDFRSNALTILYRDYELKIKEQFLKQQEIALKGEQPNTLIIMPPREQTIKEAMNILYEVYLAGQDSIKRNKSK